MAPPGGRSSPRGIGQQTVAPAPPPSAGGHPPDVEMGVLHAMSPSHADGGLDQGRVGAGGGVDDPARADAPPPERDLSQLVPGCCEGAATFNIQLTLCCALLLITPIVLIVLGHDRGDDDAFLLAGYGLLGLGVCLCLYLSRAVIGGAIAKPAAPEKHGPFRNATVGDPVSRTVSVTKICVIVNPFGGLGKGKAVLEEVLPVFKARGVHVDVLETKFAGHPKVYARTLDIDEYQAVCAIGGDGTAHELVNGLLSRTDGKKVPLGFIPAGSGNSIMMDLGTWSPVVAAERIAAGVAVPIDALHVTDSGTLDVWSINGVFWGLVGDVAVASEKRWLRSMFGPARYDVVAVWSVLKGQKYPAEVTIDGQRVNENSFLTCFVNNTQHFGKALRATPHAYMDDGVVDCVFAAANTLSAGQKLNVFNQLPDGLHVSNPDVHMKQASHITICPSAARDPHMIPFNVDGEVMAFDTKLDMRCKMKCLEIFAPVNITPMEKP